MPPPVEWFVIGAAVRGLLSVGLVAVAATTARPLAAADTPAIAFREVSEPWGVKFRHTHGGTGEYYMAETMGSGVAAFDYDGDGDDDLFFVDSGPMPGYEGAWDGSKLFRNDVGRFVDVTDGSRLSTDGSYGMGAAAADVDGDGDVDLYVTAFGPNRLFENLGDGTFREISSAGTGDDRFGVGAAFFDGDRDGDLDLYLVNYVTFTLENNPKCGKGDLGIRSYCHPDVFDGVADVYLRNRGDGTFEDATEVAGLAVPPGTGLGVVATDVDADGWPDLYVANDMLPNSLFRNRGDGTFEDVALLSGVALSERGSPEASMGVAVGDLDGDARPEIAVTHLDNQTNAYYGSIGGGLFVDRRYAFGLAEESINLVGFGVAFVDLDHDGWLDVAVANGHIIDNIELWNDVVTFEQPNQIFRNRGDGRFELVAASGLDEIRSSRGLAAADLDLDGDLDLVFQNSNDRADVYENVGASLGWLMIEPVTVSGAPAVGARVTVDPAGRELVREVRAGASYASQHSSAVHFGLGPGRSTGDAVRVTAADGSVLVFRGLPGDRRVRVRSPG